MSLVRPKSDILSESFFPRRQFLAARSLWVKCRSERYFMPRAIWRLTHQRSGWKVGKCDTFVDWRWFCNGLRLLLLLYFV